MYSVLLVDDEPMAIEGLKLFVDWESLGFRICGVCENGEEALEAVKTKTPDVVFTDIRMPVLDGLDLIGRLREEGVQLPEFVILSGYSEFAYAKRAMQLGVRHYLMKPVIEDEASEVLRRLHSRLEAKSMQARPEGIAMAETGLPVDAVRQVRGVIEAIELLDGELAADRIRAIFDGRSEGASPAAGIGMLAQHMVLQCDKLMRQRGGDPAFLAGDEGMESQPAAATPDAWIAFAQRVIAVLRACRERKPASTLEEIDRYIHEHYRENLSIKQVAARFYLHPVYLGKVYHEKFGTSLMDRVHELRIEEAMRLLRETDRNTGTVAEEVGYAHYHHFLQHFGKRNGLKPAEYRARTRMAPGHILPKEES